MHQALHMVTDEAEISTQVFSGMFTVSWTFGVSKSLVLGLVLYTVGCLTVSDLCPHSSGASATPSYNKIIPRYCQKCLRSKLPPDEILYSMLMVQNRIKCGLETSVLDLSVYKHLKFVENVNWALCFKQMGKWKG